MKKIKTILTFLVLLVVITGASYVLFSKDKKAPSNTIVFGISPFQDTFMPILGKEKGWYEEVGLNVEFKVLGWTEIQESLSSNGTQKIDIGINNISSVIASHHNNPEIIYLYGFNTFDNGFALMIRPNSELKPLTYFLEQGINRKEAIKLTAEQLKNKTVITTSNTDMEQGVAAATQRGLLSFEKDIKIINLNPDEGLAAFLSGEGDAYIGGIPQRTRATKEGMVEMLTGVDLGPAPINGIVSTKSFYNSNKDDVLKLLKVWFKIVNYTNDNMEEVAEIIVSKLNETSASNFTVDDFKIFWNNYEHYPATIEEIQNSILDSDGDNYWKSRWDDTNYYFNTVVKTIPKPVSPKDAFYMNKVQDELKN
ncbi:ABC transporter substrate-binding protein [Tenacibaculum agarivorans]|uniref:ABC transporter substrate-binding protein n=1 Tax=Tenacibaculum agarivorans TaxID=1908389 RepID=UPI00094BB295|nr:ABC transporter substrate-binding protein [Tenacibaculum agarivorans]